MEENETLINIDLMSEALLQEKAALSDYMDKTKPIFTSNSPQNIDGEERKKLEYVFRKPKELLSDEEKKLISDFEEKQEKNNALGNIIGSFYRKLKLIDQLLLLLETFIAKKL